MLGAPEIQRIFASTPDAITSLDLERQQHHRFFGQRPEGQARETQLAVLNSRLTENPDDLGARLQRAQLLGPRDEALDDYNYIIEREPDNVAALLGRAAWHESSYNLDNQALPDYRHVLEIEPQNELALAGVERLAPSTPRPE